MSAPTGSESPTPPESWPTDTYFHEFHKLSEYFNGEAVIIYHEPAANTDGDSIVFFRHSEVISAGDIFSTVSYPVIDRENGGSVQGVIDGLNHILDLAVAEYRSQGGTWIVPWVLILAIFGAMVALFGELRLMKKVSSGSSRSSEATTTGTVRFVSPGASISVVRDTDV